VWWLLVALGVWVVPLGGWVVALPGGYRGEEEEEKLLGSFFVYVCV